MSKIEKLLEKMRRNPCDWRIEDLEALALRYGLEVRQPSGSHAVFFHKATGKQLSVPAKRPIKPIYITAFIALLDEIEVDDEEDEI
jgi:predicted RNA binding protein YcfA (HicA-like mRNA interferase family)